MMCEEEMRAWLKAKNHLNIFSWQYLQAMPFNYKNVMSIKQMLK